MLSEFFSRQSRQWRVINVGRRVVPLGRNQFQQMEKQQLPYPYPLHREAQLAVLSWKQQESPAIWFFKFPVDEQGFLSHDALFHCLSILSGRDQVDEKEYQSQLRNNPYGFSPSDQQRALVFSQANRIRRQPASMHFELALDYFQGTAGWENWQQIPFQGLADLASLSDKPEYAQILVDALPNLPAPAFTALCQVLEQCPLPLPLVEAFVAIAERALSGSEVALTPAIDSLRAISASPSAGITRQLCDRLLDCAEHSSDPDGLLIVIAARVWEVLEQKERMLRYLELLATRDPQLFVGLVSELSALPAIKPVLMKAFRDPQRSDTLSAALGKLFSSLNTTHH